LFGDLTEFHPAFNFAVDPTLPPIPPAPTANEDLGTKPQAQTSYKDRYQVALQPTRDSEKMRKLYYTLQKKVDKDIQTVLDALKQSPHKDNTIVIFTSDHGDLLGAHGGLFQKWKVAYEEAIHTPLIFHWPGHFTPHKVDTLTSSVDLLPTILALAGISIPDTMLQLQASHSEVHRPVGKDLSKELYSCEAKHIPTQDVLYFMTDDEPFSGLDSTSLFGTSYPPVREPAHLETVITRIDGDLYKYTRYFDNPQFWSSPGDQNVLELIEDVKQDGPIEEKKSILITKTTPVADQLEMYNVTQDPLEIKNLATEYKTPESEKIQFILADILSRQCKLKRLTPKSGPVPGVYNCPCSRVRFPRPS
jgi:arylsulfatase A-like enzyme